MAETSSIIHAGEHERDDSEAKSCVMADEPKDESEFFIDDDSVEFLHQKLGIDSMSKSIDNLSKLVKGAIGGAVSAEPDSKRARFDPTLECRKYKR